MSFSIDKDLRLFLPEHHKFLLFGGNFLFSKRLYEIFKRNFSIKRIDYKNKIYSSKKILNLIEYFDSEVFIISSEIFQVINNKDFLKIIDLTLSAFQTKIIFINIENDFNFKFKKSTYKKRVLAFKKILNYKKDICLEFSSFLTYVDSNIQENKIHKIKKNFDPGFDVYLADEVIDFLITNLNKTGILKYSPKNCELFSNVLSKALSQNKCVLNLIYRKKPEEIVENVSVARWRYEIGTELFYEIPHEVIEEIDLIVPVPDTGKYYAQGISDKMNKPYVEAFIKKIDVGRSLDIESVKKRKNFLKTKFEIIHELVFDKCVGIVDEAIFSGLTLKEVVFLLKEAKAKKIYFFIPTPECKKQCQHNTQPKRILLSEKYSKKDMPKYFNVEGVFFMSLKNFNNIISKSKFSQTCF